MIYAWAIERVEDPEKFIATLSDPIPGKIGRRERPEMIEQELAQLEQFGITPE